MIDWKNNIDNNIAVLLKRAADCQIEMGTNDLVINKKNVALKKSELSKRWMTLKKNKKEITEDIKPGIKTESRIEISKYRSLTGHNKAICECQSCSLGATRTRFVYGVGNPIAEVMFIGEAPGRDEDLKGEPFVGRAGQLLDKILAAIGFSRENQVYIANILKCRPPNNRDPQPDEMATCMPYLREQIRLIKPKIICALGRIAAQALLDTQTPLGKLRGSWHEFENTPLIVTYHPAALLRFQKYKKDCWEDIQKLKAKYDILKQE